MKKNDYAHRLTDKQLAALEKRITAVYKEVAEELQKTIDAYFESFAKRDDEMKERIGTIINGKEWTDQDYKQWRLAQIGRGKRFVALRDKLAKRMTNANETAVSYTNDATPGIYSLNRNFAAYTIEQQVGAEVGFDLWDEQTVKRLIVEQPDLMPYFKPKREVNRVIDLAYGKRQITATVTSGILQGKSIKGLADDLHERIPTMGRNSAIRTARTAVTAAQNAGRMDSYAAAEEIGIEMEREWVATLDNRTRHAHRTLDGKTAPLDKPFIVDDHEIMYPGDPSAPGYLTYNCRCTLIAKVKGVDMSDAKRRSRDPETGETVLIENMSYGQWIKEKGGKDYEKHQKENKKSESKEPEKPKFTPALSIEEAEEYARQHIFSGSYLGKVFYKGIDVDIANSINETLETIIQKYGRKPSGIEVVNPKTAKGLKSLGGSADAPFATNSLTGMVYINKEILKNAKTFRAYNDKGTEAFKFVIANKDKLTGQMRSLAEVYEKAGKDLVDSSLEGMITHEYGHYLIVEINPKGEIVSKITDGMGKHLISGYSQHNVREYLAECFTEYERGDRKKLDPIVIELFERAIKG